MLLDVCIIKCNFQLFYRKEKKPSRFLFILLNKGLTRKILEYESFCSGLREALDKIWDINSLVILSLISMVALYVILLSDINFYFIVWSSALDTTGYNGHRTIMSTEHIVATGF